jgi:ribosomal 30S subunit maturation factor RimM
MLLIIKNETVGKVISVVNFGAGDLLEILFLKSNKNEFFRFTEQNFPSINIKEKNITIKS